MAAKITFPSSNLMQADRTMASWICRETAPVPVLLLHPHAASQHPPSEMTKAWSPSPAGPPRHAGKPGKPPDFMMKLVEAGTGARNRHWSDSREIRILKKGGWRKGWVTEIARWLPLQRSKEEGEGCWNENTLLFSPVAIRKLTGKKKPALVQQLEMGVSPWTGIGGL